MNTLEWEATLSNIFCLPSHLRSTLIGKNRSIASIPLWTDSFQEELSVDECKHAVITLVKWQKVYQVHPQRGMYKLARKAILTKLFLNPFSIRFCKHALFRICCSQSMIFNQSTPFQELAAMQTGRQSQKLSPLWNGRHLQVNVLKKMWYDCCSKAKLRFLQMSHIIEKLPLGLHGSRKIEISLFISPVW